MKKHFEELLALLEEFVNKNIDTREKIAKVKSDGTLSQAGQEQKINPLKSQLVNYGNECVKQADAIIDKINIKAQESKELDLVAIKPVIDYIMASGKSCDSTLLESVLKAFRGNLASIKAIYSVAENNGLNTACMNAISSLFFNPDAVIDELKENCRLVFIGSASATDCGNLIVKQADVLGIDITSNIKDEYVDSLKLRKMFGLSNDEQ